ncbi:MAG: glycoside hydrolase family 28 protein [Cyclobacteriaceae bacterium]
MKYFALLIISIVLISCSKPKIGPDYTALADIPTIEQVGAKALPETIVPVDAPFEMSTFRKPTFPNKEINIIDKGAKQNELVTTFIQQAIDELSGQGGGTVLIPAGNWKTGRITLKSNINLHFSDGAVVSFSTDVKDYQPAVFTRVESLEIMTLAACIYANGTDNIAITGSGRLIGPYGGEIKERSYMKPIEGLVDLTKPAVERIHDGSKEEWIFPPKFISPINCTNVYIEGISLENTAFWNIVPVYCDGVIIRGVTVNSVGIPRGDGIDIESSKNVLIEYCTLSTGDDCFTMKAGRGEDGLKVNKPTENVVVRYCLAREGHGGITCGSETAGTIRNLYVHDCVFEGTGVGIRFKTRRPRGGGGENLYYNRIRMNIKYTVIKWDMLGTPAYVGELAERLPAREVNALTPFYRNVKISNIIVENGTHFLKIYGLPESPMTNLTIDNADVKSENLIILNDAENITIQNSKISTPDSLMEILGSKKIKFENVNFDLGGDEIVIDMQDNNSDKPEMVNCEFSKSE